VNIPVLRRWYRGGGPKVGAKKSSWNSVMGVNQGIGARGRSAVGRLRSVESRWESQVHRGWRESKEYWDCRCSVIAVYHTWRTQTDVRFEAQASIKYVVTPSTGRMVAVSSKLDFRVHSL
jgi:hypothetical protein